MYSAYKLNKQGDSIQPWRTPFPIWNQSVIPCPVLTVASWPAYRFLKRQVRWSGIPIFFTVFYSLLWSTQLSHVLLFCDTMDCNLPASSIHRIFQQEYWSGLPFPSPGDLPDPGIEPMSHALQADFYWATREDLIFFLSPYKFLIQLWLRYWKGLSVLQSARGLEMIPWQYHSLWKPQNSCHSLCQFWGIHSSVGYPCIPMWGILLHIWFEKQILAILWVLWKTLSI